MPSATHLALRGVANATSPAAAAQAVLEVCVDVTGSASGRLHMLDLMSGRYVPYPESADGAKPFAGQLDIPDERIVRLSHFHDAAHAASANGQHVDGSVVFAFRGASCVGGIALEGPTPEALPRAIREELVEIAHLLVPIYEDRFAFNLLSLLQRPVDFTQPEEDFLVELTMIVADASGMEFAVLWEAMDDALRCIAIWGFEDSEESRRRWDLPAPERFDFVKKVLDGDTLVYPNGPRDADVDLPHLPDLDVVGSCVLTPIRVGTETFGVIAVAARCPFDYAPLELSGFESLANSIGVAITNFRTSHHLSARVSDWSQSAVAITAIEVAQAARHEAAGLLDNCQAILLGVHRKLERELSVVEEDLDEASLELTRVNEALNRIKTAARPPERTRSQIGVQELWEQARTAVAGRLSDLRVAVQYTGPDVTVDASPDWLRQVFLNLLLNSIDAFREAKKQGRRIELSVARPSPRANSVDLVYRDNATGINPQALKVPDEHVGKPLAQLIFEPSVTSKRTGSGFGLWLVRRILDDHHGSIDLRDYRSGITFAIKLPTADEARTHGKSRT